MTHSSIRPDQTSRPPLRGLEVCCTVARQGSLTAAADILGMTHGAVSRHVRHVEDWLDLRLFDRHGRGVRPTPEGQRFFLQVEHAFAQIDAAADRWQKRRGRDVVRLSTTPTFAKLWLLPRLLRLEAMDPPIFIEVAAQQSFADIERGEVDVAIRYTRAERLPASASLFMRERLYPVASRDFAKHFGEGPLPEDILSCPLLHDTDAAKWRAWCEVATDRPFRPKVRDRRFEDYVLCLSAAEAGLGVALGQSPLIDGSQHSGLVRLSPIEAESPFAYFFLLAPGADRPAVASLLARLRAELQDDTSKSSGPALAGDQAGSQLQDHVSNLSRRRQLT